MITWGECLGVNQVVKSLVPAHNAIYIGVELGNWKRMQKQDVCPGMLLWLLIVIYSTWFHQLFCYKETQAAINKGLELYVYLTYFIANWWGYIHGTLCWWVFSRASQRRRCGSNYWAPSWKKRMRLKRREGSGANWRATGKLPPRRLAGDNATLSTRAYLFILS